MYTCHLIGLVMVLLTTFNLLLANNISKDNTQSDDCFERFAERTTNVTHSYADEYENCQNYGTARRTSLTQNEETVKEQIENGIAQICGSMQKCNTYRQPEEFFQCYFEISFDNVDTMISIHLNASAVVVDLSTQYEQAEKEVHFCTIEAQRHYMTESREALEELKICLER